jgi:hypothetical protein
MFCSFQAAGKTVSRLQEPTYQASLIISIGIFCGLQSAIKNNDPAGVL